MAAQARNAAPAAARRSLRMNTLPFAAPLRGRSEIVPSRPGSVRLGSLGRIEAVKLFWIFHQYTVPQFRLRRPLGQKVEQHHIIGHRHRIELLGGVGMRPVTTPYAALRRGF